MKRTPPEKPLFIPLKTQFFEAFKDGSKSTEYRKLGPRWNADTCRIGRAVVLSKGYGKAHRLRGIITDFDCHQQPAKIPGWIECYGSGEGEAACITIRLNAAKTG